MDKSKLSKCVIVQGKEILKELEIEFEDLIVERPQRINKNLKLKGKEENGKQTTN